MYAQNESKMSEQMVKAWIAYYVVVVVVVTDACGVSLDGTTRTDLLE